MGPKFPIGNGFVNGQVFRESVSLWSKLVRSIVVRKMGVGLAVQDGFV